MEKQFYLGLGIIFMLISVGSLWIFFTARPDYAAGGGLVPFAYLALLLFTIPAGLLFLYLGIRQSNPSATGVRKELNPLTLIGIGLIFIIHFFIPQLNIPWVSSIIFVFGVVIFLNGSISLFKK